MWVLLLATWAEAKETVSVMQWDRMFRRALLASVSVCVLDNVLVIWSAIWWVLSLANELVILWGTLWETLWEILWEILWAFSRGLVSVISWGTLLEVLLEFWSVILWVTLWETLLASLWEILLETVSAILSEFSLGILWEIWWEEDKTDISCTG